MQYHNWPVRISSQGGIIYQSVHRTQTTAVLLTLKTVKHKVSRGKPVVLTCVFLSTSLHLRGSRVIKYLTHLMTALIILQPLYSPEQELLCPLQPQIFRIHTSMHIYLSWTLWRSHNIYYGITSITARWPVHATTNDRCVVVQTMWKSQSGRRNTEPQGLRCKTNHRSCVEMFIHSTFRARKLVNGTVSVILWNQLIPLTN